MDQSHVKLPDPQPIMQQSIQLQLDVTLLQGVVVILSDSAGALLVGSSELTICVCECS